MNNIKSFLAAYPLVGFGSSIGGGVLPFIVSITPVLQFLGVCLGLFIGYLTVEAKLEARKTRKRNNALGEDMIRKNHNALAQKAKDNQHGANGITYGEPKE
jgi:hypothetical protein